MPTKKFILAIDQGTTGTTALVVDADHRVVGRANQEFAQIYPQPAWVEHDPQAIWHSVMLAVRGAIAAARIRPDDLAGIGITNQRETTVIWDRESGSPIHHALVWQDRRTTEDCTQLKARGLEPLIQERTGLVIDPYFSATKIRWLLDNVSGAKSLAAKGRLAFGTIDTYLIWRLSNGRIHVTDTTNASRTMLFNLQSNCWDSEILQLLQIPESILPIVKPSSCVYGETAEGIDVLPAGIPIAAAAGDQQSALFGQACFRSGQIKCTYGTGAFLLCHTGEKIIRSNAGLLTTAACQLSGKPAYAVEGSTFIAGAAVQWLRDELKLISSASEIEPLASQVADSGGVVFVPAFVGLGAPYWSPDARGTIFGLTRGSNRAHIARAVLDGIALQLCDLIDSITSDTGQLPTAIQVDGGASQNNLLMQLQANYLGITLTRPQNIETTAMGAAYLAGLATGVWPNTDAITAAWRSDKVFTASMSDSARQHVLERWHRAITMTRAFSDKVL